MEWHCFMTERERERVCVHFGERLDHTQLARLDSTPSPHNITRLEIITIFFPLRLCVRFDYLLSALKIQLIHRIDCHYCCFGACSIHVRAIINKSCTRGEMNHVRYAHTLWFIIQLFHYCRTKRHSHTSSSSSSPTNQVEIKINNHSIVFIPIVIVWLREGNFFCSRTQ